MTTTPTRVRRQPSPVWGEQGRETPSASPSPEATAEAPSAERAGVVDGSQEQLAAPARRHPTGQSNIFADAQAIGVPVTRLGGRPWWLQAIGRLPESLALLRTRSGSVSSVRPDRRRGAGALARRRRRRRDRAPRTEPALRLAGGGGIAGLAEVLRAIPTLVKATAVVCLMVVVTLLVTAGGSISHGHGSPARLSARAPLTSPRPRSTPRQSVTPPRDRSAVRVDKPSRPKVRPTRVHSQKRSRSPHHARRHRPHSARPRRASPSVSAPAAPPAVSAPPSAAETATTSAPPVPSPPQNPAPATSSPPPAQAPAPSPPSQSSGEFNFER
jgi:hypothetical protein